MLRDKKKITYINDLSTYMNFMVKPNFKEVGKIFGKNIKEFSDKLLELSNEDINKLKLIDLVLDKKLKSKIYMSLKNKELIKKNIKNLTHEDALSFLLSLSDEEKIEYINKGYYVPILICSLSIENFYKEFGLISDTNKLECIDKIEIPSVKFEILSEYKNLFTKEALNAYMSRIYVDTFDKNVREKIQRFFIMKPLILLFIVIHH